jgi:hypothetical protein
VLLGGGLESWVLVATTELLLLAIWIRNRRPNVSWVVSYGFVVSALVVSVATTEFSDFLFATAGGGLGNADAETLLEISVRGAAPRSWPPGRSSTGGPEATEPGSPGRRPARASGLEGNPCGARILGKRGERVVARGGRLQ